jgi:hypothetical protein
MAKAQLRIVPTPVEPWTHPLRFPFRTRWRLWTIRERATWKAWWHDLIYLVKG